MWLQHTLVQHRTATGSKMRFIHHNVAPDGGILNNDILKRIESEHVSVTICKCEHTLQHKSRKKWQAGQA